MKSHKIQKGDSPRPSYPYLGLNNDADLIVLFTRINSGFVIHSPESQYEIGYQTGSWNEDNFSPFEGDVLLSNEN